MIREANKQDYSQIQEIALDCFDHNVAKYSNLSIARFMMKRYYREKAIESRAKAGAVIFVDEENQNVRGFIEIKKDFYISNIFVSTKYQRHGIGQNLMQEGMNWCESQSEEDYKITLDATKDAIKFYEKLGFVFLNRTKSQFGVSFYPMEKVIKKF